MLTEEERKKRLKDSQKKYASTEKGKKKFRIKDWKRIGVISDDYNLLYDKFMNCKNCEHCDIEMVYGRTRNGKTLDHCHISGEVRNILCRACNNKLPKQEKIFT